MQDVEDGEKGKKKGGKVRTKQLARMCLLFVLTARMGVCLVFCHPGSRGDPLTSYQVDMAKRSMCLNYSGLLIVYLQQAFH